jgi:PRTase ComF-like
MYSRFKFGDIPALHAMVQMLTAAIITDLESGGQLSKVFELARDNGDFISLTAPGVRNVISASNQLAREVGLRVNAWLALQGMPTMIIRTLGRLSSGRANYAALSAKQRATEAKTTQTIIPRSEYQDFPSHVIFLDDVEVTGTTCNRARQKSLKAGALSFHAIFAFKVDPAQASHDASIEHRMNQCVITGRLDAGLAEVLQDVDYQPVQRMLRLLLQPDNRATLQDFLKAHVSDRILQRIFLGAMANDYLWIHAEALGVQGEYGPSLEIMADEMRARRVLDASGRIVDAY